MFKRGIFLAICALAIGGNASARSAIKEPSKEEIKRSIIEQSVASYPGNCPCPYNTARNGSRCGKRSAYSRAGGYSVICYPEDVTDEMVDRYKKK